MKMPRTSALERFILTEGRLSLSPASPSPASLPSCSRDASTAGSYRLINGSEEKRSAQVCDPGLRQHPSLSV